MRDRKFPLIIIASSLVLGLLAYPSLPSRIPIHWNAAGEVDNWAAKSPLSAFFPVLIMIAVYLLMLFLPRIDPFKKNYERFADTYSIVISAFISFFGALYLITTIAALRPSLDIPLLASVSVGLFFLVVGNFMGRVKRNFFLGIRTPWTLANEHVWVKTHRLAGRLMVLVGFVMIISGIILPGEAAFAVTMAAILMFGLIITVYSYLMFRNSGQVQL